jgi:Protein of unknown function (DUF3800)
MIAARSNPLLDHVWGISLGADRVWAQIVGIAPSSEPWARLFIVIQLKAFIDDSYRKDGVYVLGGYIASAAAWAKLAKDWEELLPLFGRRKSNGKYHFKMSEMARHIDHVVPFHHVIERHIGVSLAFQMRLDDLDRARRRIIIEGTHLVWQLNPFKFAFRELLKHFHLARVEENKELLERRLPLESPVDFYFDKESSSSEIIGVWERFVATRPENIRHLYGSMPRFEDDEVFLPLQAADFWAWWVRKGAEDGNLQQIANADFGFWKGRNNIMAIVIRASEDQLVQSIITALQAEYGDEWTIRDGGR